MTDNFDPEAFRLKAQSVLGNKSLISNQDYVVQLENLLLELQPGNSPVHPDTGIAEIQGYLDKAKARIDSLFYHAPVGYCVIDAGGKIIATNRAFCSLLFLDQSTIDGALLQKYIHPDSLELFHFQVNKIINAQTTLSANLRFLRGDKDLLIRFQTTYYSEGEHKYLQCIATDISDAKSVENELAASEAQFRNLLEASPLGILVMYKGKYIYSNQAAADIFGYEHPDELIGKTVMDTIAEGSKAMIKERMLRLEHNSANETAVGDVICRDGQHKTCETVSIPVIFNNRLSGLIIVSDISARHTQKGY